MFGLEPWHLVLLLGVVLVVFGPKRLPEIGKSLGTSISEFRKATSEFGDAAKGVAPLEARPLTVSPSPGSGTPAEPSGPVPGPVEGRPGMVE